MVFPSYNNIISSLGFNSQENFEAILNSKIGIKKKLFSFSDNPFHVSEIEQNKLSNYCSNIQNANKFTKLEQLSILSIQDIINQSGLNPNDEKLLLIYSTTKGNIDILENKYENFDSNRAYLPELGKILKTYFKFHNEPQILSNACISGLLAIIIAKRYIEQGLYNNVIVCGGDLLTEFTMSGFKSFNALSNEPCRPFDANRTGINLGEAVASILISNNEKFADLYETEIVSGSSANDANHISGPSRTGDGLFQCLSKLSLNNQENIGFISAHGTATPFNDEMESVAFDRAGLNSIPVNSLKGYYGHTLGAAGVLETILSLESLKHQTLIKSAGFETKGVSGNICFIENFENKKFNSFIKTASGFGGCNAAALFAKIR
jgi:3-oxoacyl-[acyl-carrier-protein] synthase-1